MNTWVWGTGVIHNTIVVKQRGDRKKMFCMFVVRAVTATPKMHAVKSMPVYFYVGYLSRATLNSLLNTQHVINGKVVQNSTLDEFRHLQSSPTAPIWHSQTLKKRPERHSPAILCRSIIPLLSTARQYHSTLKYNDCSRLAGAG